MKVFAYYEPSLAGQQALLNLWSRSWAANGWEPELLNESVAHRHPRYAEFDAHVRTLPTVNPRDYERSCYLRWLAFQVVGGGLLVDYDVINYGVPAGEIIVGDLTVHEYNRVPCAVSATPKELNKVVSSILNHKPRHDEKHTSDMFVFKGMTDATCLVNPLVAQYGDRGWTSASLVHFPTDAVKTAGFANKVECINATRPLR